MLNRKVLILLGGFGLLLVWSAWRALQSATPRATDDDDDTEGPLILSKQELFLQPGHVTTVRFLLRHVLSEDMEMTVVMKNQTTIRATGIIVFKKNLKSAMNPLIIRADQLGECTVTFSSHSTEVKDLYKVKLKVHVVRSLYLYTLSSLIGWGYFIAWSVSYYPQVYENWRRRSVVGYSFEFLAISGSGQLCYAIYNAALCWSPIAQKQFLELHPGSDLPVKTNDNFYTIHGIFLVIITVTQCIIYDRGSQKILLPVQVLLIGVGVAACGALLGVVNGSILLLTWLNFLSLVKLAASPLQYTPQVFLNYSNKSTKGWSIYGVFLDFSGGSLSFFQVVIDLANTGLKIS